MCFVAVIHTNATLKLYTVFLTPDERRLCLEGGNHLSSSTFWEAK